MPRPQIPQADRMDDAQSGGKVSTTTAGKGKARVTSCRDERGRPHKCALLPENIAR